MEFLKAIQAIRNPVLDAFFSFITRFGEETAVIVLLCAVFWCLDKKLAYCVGVSYFVSGLLVQALKIGFRVARPWIIDPEIAPVASALAEATGYSFPSGHTQSAAALFITAAFYLKNRAAKIGCFALVVLVGFSRLYLGVHTPLDVSVGFLLSVAAAYLTVRFFRNDRLAERGGALAAGMLTLAAATVVFAFFVYSGGAITENYLADCLKAAGAGTGFAAGMFIERRHINFSPECEKPLMQPVKYAAGLAGILVIKEGLKLILGTSLALDMFRYALMGLWMTAIFASVIKSRFQSEADVR